MKYTQLLPIIMIMLDVAAGVICLIAGENRKAIYWLAAAVLNASVTF